MSKHSRKHGRTTRRRKMRGGTMGQIEITWTLHGDSDETVDLNQLLNEYEGEDFDTSKIQDDIRSQVESHVSASGYRNPNTDPMLNFVDVEFDGEEGSAVPKLETAFAGPEGRMELTATFELDMTGGGKRRRRRTKKTRSRRRRV